MFKKVTKPLKKGEIESPTDNDEVQFTAKFYQDRGDCFLAYSDIDTCKSVQFESIFNKVESKILEKCLENLKRGEAAEFTVSKFYLDGSLPEGEGMNP